jgi:hypothetical protein
VLDQGAGNRGRLGVIIGHRAAGKQRRGTSVTGRIVDFGPSRPGGYGKIEAIPRMKAT